MNDLIERIAAAGGQLQCVGARRLRLTGPPGGTWRELADDIRREQWPLLRALWAADPRVRDRQHWYRDTLPERLRGLGLSSDAARWRRANGKCPTCGQLPCAPDDQQRRCAPCYWAITFLREGTPPLSATGT